MKKLAFVVVRIVRARVPEELLAWSTTLVISGDGWRGSSRQWRGWYWRRAAHSSTMISFPSRAARPSRMLVIRTSKRTVSGETGLPVLPSESMCSVLKPSRPSPVKLLFESGGRSPLPTAQPPVRTPPLSPPKPGPENSAILEAYCSFTTSPSEKSHGSATSPSPSKSMLNLEDDGRLSEAARTRRDPSETRRSKRCRVDGPPLIRPVGPMATIPIFAQLRSGCVQRTQSYTHLQ